MLTRTLSLAKQAMGGLPLTAEIYQRWWAPQQVPSGGYSLQRLQAALPAWLEAAATERISTPPVAPRRVLLIGYLKWWLEFAAAIGAVLAAMGHSVDLGFLPYRRWTAPVPPFDLRRQRAYLQQTLHQGRSWFRPVDLSHAPRRPVASEAVQAIRDLSCTDVQYTCQREDVDLEGAQSSLFQLRQERNLIAAANLEERLARRRYDVVIVPNGSILEFGAAYQTARRQGVPVVTYEFGERRENVWLARDAEVMRHDTGELWRSRGAIPLSEAERGRLEQLMAARRRGRPWSNFARRWQPSAGVLSGTALQDLGLDPTRPVVLLCTNVVGDSLALGRQVFTRGMADWLSLTVQYFARRPEAQLIVRVHPGELLGAGHPSQEIVHAALPEVAPKVHLVPPDSRLNTYDLMDTADIGLVYTTTVGLEMAMAGLPVVVAGQTHYRGKGFTLDVSSADEYRSSLDRLLADPAAHRARPEQLELAWRYAYRFFFEFPRPFPWHLLQFWEDVALRPVETIVRRETRAPYQATFDSLLGDPVRWGQDAAE